MPRFSRRSPGRCGTQACSKWTIEQLIFNTLYARGELTGRKIADTLGLSFSVIEPLMEELKVRQFFEVKRSLGYGLISSVFALSEAAGNGPASVMRSIST